MEIKGWQNKKCIPYFLSHTISAYFITYLTERKKERIYGRDT